MRRMGVRATFLHGTVSRYKAGCRCDACRDAKARVNKQYRERRRAARPPGVQQADGSVGKTWPELVADALERIEGRRSGR